MVVHLTIRCSVTPPAVTRFAEQNPRRQRVAPELNRYANET